ncbi:hypothetical protein BX600DRAFT_307464 [Xylariales sp. PMI_506]|nr:hypothetical protein BX600DRAFT_307464 [Xylariales sp. PMI_506]
MTHLNDICYSTRTPLLSASHYLAYPYIKPSSHNRSKMVLLLAPIPYLDHHAIAAMNTKAMITLRKSPSFAGTLTEHNASPFVKPQLLKLRHSAAMLTGKPQPVTIPQPPRPPTPGPAPRPGPLGPPRPSVPTPPPSPRRSFGAVFDDLCIAMVQMISSETIVFLRGFTQGILGGYLYPLFSLLPRGSFSYWVDYVTRGHTMRRQRLHYHRIALLGVAAAGGQDDSQNCGHDKYRSPQSSPADSDPNPRSYPGTHQ